MKSDIRYAFVKSLLRDKNIPTFQDALNIISKSRIAADAEISYPSFLNKMKTPKLFTLEDIIKMAKTFDMSPMEICERIFTDLKAI